MAGDSSSHVNKRGMGVVGDSSSHVGKTGEESGRRLV